MKSYTDLEQSKKLTEILPLESADMYYEPSTGYCTEPSEVRFGNIKYAHPRSIKCWSLAALLDVLPKGTNISTPDPLDKIRYSCRNDYDITYASNPVDACYDMILKLHELNLL